MTVTTVPSKSGSITKLRMNTSVANGTHGGGLVGEHIALSSPPPLKPTHAIVKMSGHSTIDYDDDDVIDVMGLADCEVGALGAVGGCGSGGGVITYRTEEISTNLPAGHEMLLLRQTHAMDGTGADAAFGDIVFVNEQQQSSPQRHGVHKRERETTTLV